MAARPITQQSRKSVRPMSGNGIMFTAVDTPNSYESNADTIRTSKVLGASARQNQEALIGPSFVGATSDATMSQRCSHSRNLRGSKTIQGAHMRPTHHYSNTRRYESGEGAVSASSMNDSVPSFRLGKADGNCSGRCASEENGRGCSRPPRTWMMNTEDACRKVVPYATRPVDTEPLACASCVACMFASACTGWTCQCNSA